MERFHAYIEVHANDNIIAREDAYSVSEYGAKVAAFDKVREVIQTLKDKTKIYVYIDIETAAGHYVSHVNINGVVRKGELEVV